MAILANATPIFTPAMRIIDSITQAQQAVITTTFDHDYIDGIIIRLVVPPGYGMVEANQLFGPITVINSTSFTVDINTYTFNPFSYPSVSKQYPQTIPLAEVNSTLLASTKNTLPH